MKPPKSRSASCGCMPMQMREVAFDAAKLEHLFDHQSGLIGISATSSDMRRRHEASSENPDARLAIEMFCYSGPQTDRGHDCPARRRRSHRLYRRDR
jgi:acetate kinase